MVGQPLNRNLGNQLLHGLAVTVCFFAGLRAQEPVVETFEDGSAFRRYEVDEAGRKHGKFVQYDEMGLPEIIANYADGQLHGRFHRMDAVASVEIEANYRRGVLHGKYKETQGYASTAEPRTYDATYREGVLHGAATARHGRKIVSRQRWRDGVLIKLDRLAPFDRDATELREQLAAIERGSDSGAVPVGDEARRQAALRRLQAYRHLCHLEYVGMSLDPEWNALCRDAAEVCKRNGDIDHFPPEPPGIDPDLYARGCLGARSSNLHRGGNVVDSVDGYMDDSDSSNIDRVGHRRWCLNPHMRKTGFGEVDGFTAMWAFDSSGKRPRGLDAVMYPPAGYVPVDYFGPHYAWSIAMLSGGMPKKDRVVIRVFELDEHYVAADEPLEIDHLSIGDAGQGTGPCLIFRPSGLRVNVGRKYLCEVSLDGGKSNEFRYLVEFCAAVRAH